MLGKTNRKDNWVEPWRWHRLTANGESCTVTANWFHYHLFSNTLISLPCLSPSRTDIVNTESSICAAELTARLGTAATSGLVAGPGVALFVFKAPINWTVFLWHRNQRHLLYQIKRLPFEFNRCSWLCLMTFFILLGGFELENLSELTELTAPFSWLIDPPEQRYHL